MKLHFFSRIVNLFIAKRLLVVLLVLVLGNWTITGFSQSQKQQYQVTASRLNVRSTASQKSSIIGTLNNGDVVTVLAISDGWATISYDGKKAYVSATYLQSVKEQSGKTNIASKKHNSTAYDKTSNNRTALWELSTAIMPHKSGLDWSFLIGGEFPLEIGNNDFWIHGGLRYLQCKFNESDYYSYYSYYDKLHLIEFPIKLDYDIPLSQNALLSVGAGPYYSYNITTESRALGLEPEVSLKYKRWSLSVQYSLPIFKSDDYIGAHYPMLSLSVRLGNKAMGYVAAGLVTAATVAAAIGAAVSGETFDGFNSDGYSSSVNTDSEGRYSVQDLLRKTQSEANSLRARYESEKNAVETEISTSNYSQSTKSRAQNISIMAGELKQKNLIISRLQRKQENGINYITPEEWDAIVEQAHDSERETKKLNDARRNLQKEEKESKRLRNALDKNTKAINELNRKLQ